MTLDFFNYLEQSPRVIIIDDQEDEREPIVNIFKQHNVIQYDGSKVPDEKLTNIRLVFLDLHLGSDELVKTAISVLNSHVAPPSSNGPFLLVLWTKHAEEKEKFETTIKEYSEKQPDIACPTLIVTLNKHDFLGGTTGGEADLTLLKQTIQKELEKLSPLMSVIMWEHESISAIFKVSGQLARVSAKTPGDSSGLSSLLKQLTESYAGQHNEEIASDNFQRYLREALNNILADHTDGAICVWDAGQKDINQSHVFNTWLHCANPIPGTCPPGSVYNAVDIDVIKGLMHQEDKIHLHKAVASCFEKSIESKKDDVVNNMLPIAMEITPPCDYAQGNKIMSRFLFGFAIPSKIVSEFKLKKADYLFSIREIIYKKDGSDTVGALCFNFRYIFTSLANEPNIRNKSLFLLRNNVLSDIQSHFGRHASRPGHMSL